MKNKKIVITGVVLLIVIAGAVYLKGFLDVDRCLDSGGRWNYEAKSCEYE
jgi:hypothetical protein